MRQATWTLRLSTMIKPWFQIPTEWEIICHLPFYLNIICAGYLCYWTFKLELLVYPPNDLGDATGFYHFAQIVYYLSGLVVLVVAIEASWNKRKHWRAEIVYVAMNIFIVFVLFIYIFYTMPVLPMS